MQSDQEATRSFKIAVGIRTMTCKGDKKVRDLFLIHEKKDRQVRANAGFRAPINLLIKGESLITIFSVLQK
jgi:hypothetical protein